ncbi:MAG: PD40 domain-containing protein [Chloroflexi bacterium]|nr:PD40 domain-containing protein [Chloroflexota bacterium]
MYVTHTIRSSWLILLGLLFACNTTPAPVTVVATLVPTTQPTITPTKPPPSAVPATATPLLQITLITPPPPPPPPPTTAPFPTGVISTTNAPGANTGPTSVPRPSELGNSAGDGALIAVLRRCWNVSDTRQLNGNNPAHRDAFDCARQALLDIVRNYPGYALVHRVLAWGYFYKDNDPAKAINEYRAAANIYKAQGNAAGESEARMRLALLLVSNNLAQGCAELAAAANLDPTNDRALDYYSAFNCKNAGQASTGGASAPPPALPQVDLATIKGKIAFKSNREGFPAYYVMDPDGKNVKRIAATTYDAVKQWESWSPDRTQAATVRNAGFTRKFGYDNDIWITDPQGSGRPLTNPANDYDPAWSPRPLFDGRTWIVFVSNRGDLEHPENFGEDLWVMHDDGTSPFRITCYAPFFTKHPSWSPDANQLIFSSSQQGNHGQIFVIDMGAFGTLQDNCQLGANPVNLSQNEFEETEPVWIK